jgi:hypothetical protein
MSKKDSVANFDYQGLILVGDSMRDKVRQSFVKFLSPNNNFGIPIALEIEDSKTFGIDRSSPL